MNPGTLALEIQPAEREVFVLAPSGKDARLIDAALQQAGIAVRLCADVASTVAAATGGIGALLLAEEAVRDSAALAALRGFVRRQPSWSDLPVLLLTLRGRLSQVARQAVDQLGNVTVLQRPTPVSTLLSTTLSALRTRERQYQTREAEVRKDLFLATLAHELRNPLAPLSNALHLLGSTEPADDRQRRALPLMQRQVAQLSHLVDDLLDVARITRGKITLRTEPLDLREAVQHAVENCRSAIDAMAHQFQLDLPPQPLWVEADRTRIAQCVANLLTNAAKYTPRRGRIELALTGSGSSAVIRVRDNGIGFPAGEAPQLFEAFAQVASAAPHAQGGLGLGLSIVKAMIDLHGGHVAAHSEGEGRGACFELTLPLMAAPPAEDAPPAPAGPASAGTCRVLVVDDNRDSADSLSELLQSCGHETRTAYSGSEALSTAAQWTPQIALLDIGLPDMSGHELAKQLLAQALTPRPVLVALTGWGQPADVARAIEAGFDHHLTKPADVDALLSLVDSVACR
jgi:signal transduction histidine kinase